MSDLATCEHPACIEARATLCAECGETLENGACPSCYTEDEQADNYLAQHA